MENQKIISKIFLYLAVLAGIIWLGSYIERLILSYQLFDGVEFTLRAYLNNQNLPAVFTMLDASTILTTIVYTLFIVFFSLFLVTSKISLKQNGWLFIISLIIFLTLPFEAYLIRIDYKCIMMINSGHSDPMTILNLYIMRFKILSSFPIIEILSYFAVLYLVLYRPLVKADKL